MNTIKTIRDRLGVTQAAMASGMGCSQANVSFYENGQTVPPDAAKRLIAYASTLGHEITFNDIYADGKQQTAAPEIVAAPAYAGPERRDSNRPVMAFPDLDRREKVGV